MAGRENKDAGKSARVTIAFRGVPEGEVYPKRFAVGDVVTGTLAKTAVAAGWAEEPKAATAAPKKTAAARQAKSGRKKLH